MKSIFFVEGVPGVGKSTLVKQLMSSNSLVCQVEIVPGEKVVPENPVRRVVKTGRVLSIREARLIYLNMPYDLYRDEHMRIWSEFCEQHSHQCLDIVVDAGLIQASLYELMGLYMLQWEKIVRHLQSIIDMISCTFEPRLIYIKTTNPGLCVRKAMEKQKEQREQWINGFCKWLEIAPYPVAKGYIGPTGIEKFVEDRYKLECYLLDRLRIQKDIRIRGKI